MSVIKGSPVDGMDFKKQGFEEAIYFMKSTVQLKGKKKELQADEDGLCLSSLHDEWKFGRKQGADTALTITWRNVIGVEPAPKEKKPAFSLHYIQSTPEKFLRAQCLNICLEDGDGSVDRWISTIKKQCQNVAGRPKKLLVIVNPIGGRGNVRQLYEKQAEKLFSLAGIDVTVRETERVKHGLEIVEQENLSEYDGVVCVGGDGLYQEVLQGVLLQTQRQAKVDLDDTSSTWVKSTIPIGCLPGGTGNCMVGSCNDGVNDMETAVLRIIKGEQNDGMAFLSFSNGKFLSAGGIFWAYGLFSDMMIRREELRWLGTLGLPAAILSIMLRKRRMFRCEVEYLQEKSSEKKSETDRNEWNGKDLDMGEWIRYNSNGEEVCGVHCFGREIVDVGDNKFPSLVVDRGVSTCGLIKHISTYSGGKKYETPEKLDIIENVKAFRFRLERDETETDENVTPARGKDRFLENHLIMDGEISGLDVPEVEVKVLPSFIPLYSCLPTMPLKMN